MAVQRQRQEAGSITVQEDDHCGLPRSIPGGRTDHTEEQEKKTNMAAEEGSQVNLSSLN